MRTLFTLMLLLTMPLLVAQNSKNFIDQPFIAVVGTSELEVTPDEIYVKIVLSEKDKRSNKSIEKQEENLIASLISLGIDIENCLKIQDFDGYYKRKFLASNEVVKTKVYELLVSSGKSLGEVYEVLDQLEISNVAISRITHSKIEDIKRDNKIKAIKIARQKAEDYALAIDQNIGKAIHIEEQHVTPYYASNQLDEIQVTAVGGYKRAEADLLIKKLIIKSTINAKFILN